METITDQKDPIAMKISSESSWLCGIFQDEELEKEEKKEILRSILKEFKQNKQKKENKNGQKDKEASERH